MRSTPVREVEHKRRGKPGLLLTGLAVLAAAVILHLRGMEKEHMGR